MSVKRNVFITVFFTARSSASRSASRSAPRRSNRAAAAWNSQTARSSSPSRRAARPSASRVRATSYVAPVASQNVLAWRRQLKAPAAFPRASIRFPRANAPDALSADVSYVLAASPSSSTYPSASSSSSAAIAISTAAGRSRARAGIPSESSLSARRIDESAPLTLPWLSLRSESPGSGSFPYSSASRKDASACARSPSRRRVSPSS
jgi:hypothetical protein